MNNDDFFDTPKSWSWLKYKILDYYVREYFHKVNLHYKTSAFAADLFAGAGKFDTGEDGSPIIISRYADQANSIYNLKNQVVLAEAWPPFFRELQKNVKEFVDKGVVQFIEGEAADAGSRLIEIIPAEMPLFMFLDPFGIKGLSMKLINQIFDRAKSESTEILINFNEKSLRRRIGVARNVDSGDGRSRKLALSACELLDDALGSNWWKEIIENQALTEQEQDNAIVERYVAGYRKGFKFVGTMPITKGYPNEQVKYHLIFGSRSVVAFELMNNSMQQGSQDFFLKIAGQEARGTLFEATEKEYVPKQFKPNNDLLQKIVFRECQIYAREHSSELCPPSQIALDRVTIRRLLMKKYFAKYHSRDYNGAINQLIHREALITKTKKSRINESDEFTVNAKSYS
jgi:three-Cys-motif partner protein